MAISLPDLPQAVRAYLDTKVTVVVSPFIPTGQVINPGETFTFTVTATNASAANGGVALTNVRYHVFVVGNSPLVRLVVPGNGTSFDGGGQPIQAGAQVGFFNFNPAGDDPSYLQIGESDSISVTGRAGTGAAGGNANISARIEADPDINALFPRNETSATGTRPIVVAAT